MKTLTEVPTLTVVNVNRQISDPGDKRHQPEVKRQWKRRLSVGTPAYRDNIPDNRGSISPRKLCNPETVLKKKLQKEESLLLKDTEKMLEFPKDSEERLDIQKKIQVRRNLVDAMKKTLGVHENLLLTEGYIKLRQSNNDSYVKYWCVIRHPNLRLFQTEKDPDPKDSIDISSCSEIIANTCRGFGFTLKLDKKRVQFLTDSKEECTQWQNALAHATGVELTDMKLQHSKRRSMSFSVVTDRSTPRKKQKFIPLFYPYYPPSCDDFESIESAFSEDTDTEFKNGKYSLKSGTLEDIIVWCIIHSQSKKDEDSAALFLCKHWVCTSEEFNQAIISIWKNWEEEGFPIGLPRNVLSERLATFATQYIESPVVVSIFDNEFSRFLKQQEITCRTGLKEEIQHIHPYFVKVIRGVRGPRDSVSISSENLPIPVYNAEVDVPATDPISYPSKEIAIQLTLQQAEWISRLTPGELTDKNWEDPETSPVLSTLASLCNKTTSWVISCILDAKDKKHLLSRYTKFIKIANHLHKLKNYNSCISVLGGLDSAPISRLKKLQNIPDRDQNRLDKLREIYSPCNAYSNYRNLPKSSRCIPFIGIYLRDLTLACDGNEKYIDEDKTIINFDRMRLVAKRVLELFCFDTKSYAREYQSNTVLKKHLANLNVISSDDLYEKSLSIQPVRSDKTPKQRIDELEKDKKLLKDRMEEAYKQLSSLSELLSKHIDNGNEENSTLGAPPELSYIRDQLKATLVCCDVSDS